MEYGELCRALADRMSCAVDGTAANGGKGGGRVLVVVFDDQRSLGNTRCGLSGGVADGSRNDGRALVGQMLAYDKHMNFVLSECEEFRTVKVGVELTERGSRLSMYGHSLSRPAHILDGIFTLAWCTNPW
jgi:hypothetical protein